MKTSGESVEVSPSPRAGVSPVRCLRRRLGLAVMLLAAFASIPLFASDLNPLVIMIVESGGDRYFEPAGRRIVIRSHPMRLLIRIRNTADAAVLIRASPEKAYALELKDQAGTTFMIQRKKDPGGATDDEIRVNLAQGADTIIPMQISRDTWEGFPVLKAGTATTFTARIIYETADGRHVYSEPYTLIFNIAE